MQVSYKKLWKLLIDRDMTRTELRLLSGISSVSLAKLGKDQIVTSWICFFRFPWYVRCYRTLFKHF